MDLWGAYWIKEHFISLEYFSLIKDHSAVNEIHVYR